MNDTLELYHEQSRACLRCALCQTVCPVFRELRGELASPRSKVRLVLELLEGRLKLTPRLEELLNLCIGCRRCEENCPAKIDISTLILSARAEFVKQGSYSFSKKLLLQRILGPRAAGIHWLFRALAAYRSTFPGRLLSSSGLPNLVMPNAREKEKLLPPLPGQTFFQTLETKDLDAAQGPKIGYFVGCLTNHLYPSQADAVVKVLERCGYRVEIPRTVGCCGLPHRSSGDMEEAYQLALKNIRSFTADTIVTECASCSSFLRNYSKLFVHRPEAGEFEEFSGKVCDISEFLVREGAASEIKGNPLDISVTYHDPCHLKRGQNISKEPRDVLRNIPGVKLVELEAADECCGGGGLFSLTHFELSRKILQRKLQHIAATGAGMVTTSCPACRMQLQSGFHGAPNSVQVLHPVELWARSLD